MFPQPEEITLYEARSSKAEYGETGDKRKVKFIWRGPLVDLSVFSLSTPRAYQSSGWRKAQTPAYGTADNGLCYAVPNVFLDFSIVDEWK